MIRSFSEFWHKARLRHADRISANIPFADIEKYYAGKAANFQLRNWQEIFQEKGEVYTYTEEENDEVRERLVRDLTRRLFLANEAGVYSDKGIVYNDEMNCTVLETVEEWGNDVHRSTEFLKIKKQPEKYLKGLSFSLLSIGAVYNYAHFLFDGISRLSLVNQIPKEIDWFLVSGPRKAWKEKILSYLDLTDRVIWIEGQDEVKCEQLLFTNRINFARHCSPFAVQAIRNVFLENYDSSNPSDSYRYIYASRSNAKDRKTRLEDMIVKLLPKEVEIIDFEKLSMEETIKVCQEAKLFMGFHGAAFSNTIFCNPGTHIVEFQNEDILPKWNKYYYKTSSEYMGFDYMVMMVNDTLTEDELMITIQNLLPHIND